MNGKFRRIMFDDVMKVSFITSFRAVELIHIRESAMIVCPSIGRGTPRQEYSCHFNGF